MNSLSLKLYMLLLLVGICVLNTLAAPMTPGDHAINPQEQGENPVAEPEPLSTSDVHSVTIKTPINGKPLLPAATSSSSEEDSKAQSSSPAPAVLVRVRRNKRPIRYHDKSRVSRLF